ncbi:MAG: family 10 glycosylhydrolase, partial [Phycisphaerae bacterium]|nr:family 10 glycosylhydrolase [Phycisphaerae bacterium]
MSCRQRSFLRSTSIIAVSLSLAAPTAFGASVIVDNTDSGFSVLSGTWSTTSVTGQWGTDYRYKSTSSSVTGEVEWRPNLPEAGEHIVSVWYRSTGSSRPNNARYTVHYSGGTADVYVNQQINGSVWVELGTYSFTAGTTGRVTLVDQAQTSKTIVADAVQFESTEPPGPEYRAFWVDAWGAGLLNQDEVELLLGEVGNPDSGGRIRDVNCNMVIVQVRRRADVCYPSGMGEPYMSGLTPADFNSLQAMIDAAHDTTGGKKRIEVHCWLVDFKTAKGLVYSQHSDPSDPDNYWPTRLENGNENGDGAFDPGHPRVLQYLTDVCMDLVNNFDIDGIHHDYIRFEGNTEGYNPTSVARYNERYGLTGQPSSSSEQFKQWRRDQVTAVVRKVHANIQKSKPSVKHSGSFVTWNPSPTASTRAAFMATRPYYDVYSDWDSWVEEGLVDMAVPMTYYREHELPADYVRWMNFEKDRKFNRHMIIGPGIYLNYLSNAILHLQKTREPSPAGNYAEGFSGYSYRSPYRISSDPLVYGTWDDFAPLLESDVTPTWVDIPEMPWKTAPTVGHMMGTITHPGGAWADHATVSITGPASRSMYVDGTGSYAFIDLPTGLYTITASK